MATQRYFCSFPYTLFDSLADLGPLLRCPYSKLSRSWQKSFICAGRWAVLEDGLPQSLPAHTRGHHDVAIFSQLNCSELQSARRASNGGKHDRAINPQAHCREPQSGAIVCDGCEYDIAVCLQRGRRELQRAPPLTHGGHHDLAICLTDRLRKL